MTLVVRPFAPSDFARWNELWQQYLVFYQHELSTEQTAITWQRLVDGNGPVNGFLAELDGRVVGFTHHSFTHSTWEENPAVYVEDLFVDPEVRGHGVARALAMNLLGVAKAADAPRLHWMTQSHNETARKLYDQVGELTEFIVYERHI